MLVGSNPTPSALSSENVLWPVEILRKAPCKLSGCVRPGPGGYGWSRRIRGEVVGKVLIGPVHGGQSG